VKLPRFRGHPEATLEVSAMRRYRAPYPPQYRAQLVELARAGRSPESLAEEFEPSPACIRKWVKQADVDAGRRTDGITTTEREELARLRRENDVLREEREILKKAAAWFAQETSKTPSGRSSS
jgi:transposase